MKSIYIVALLIVSTELFGVEPIAFPQLSHPPSAVEDSFFMSPDDFVRKREEAEFSLHGTNSGIRTGYHLTVTHLPNDFGGLDVYLTDNNAVHKRLWVPLSVSKTTNGYFRTSFSWPSEELDELRLILAFGNGDPEIDTPISEPTLATIVYNQIQVIKPFEFTTYGGPTIESPNDTPIEIQIAP